MLTHKELGIEQWEHDGLQLLTEFLPTLEKTHQRLAEAKAQRFNMQVACYKNGCGTTACIGGWLYNLNRVDTRESRVEAYVGQYHWAFGKGKKKEHALGELFYPGQRSGDNVYWNDIGPSEAVEGIKNFLNTGDPQWAKVLEQI